MGKITLSGHIIVPQSDLAAVLSELPTHIDLTRKEEGCLVFEVYQDQNEEQKFHVYEEFADEVSFKNHQVRTRSSKWGKVAANVERIYQVQGLSK